MAVLTIVCKNCRARIDETVKIGAYKTRDILDDHNWKESEGGYICDICKLKK